MALSPMWNRVKVWATAGLVLAAVAYIVHRFAGSQEWQQFHASHFWQGLVQVRLSYLLLAAALVFSSYFARSLRWQVFLRPMKSASLGNILASTLIGFSAVALLGRPGEVVRPVLIARKEGLAVSSQLGAWTLERVFDSLVMGTLLGAALLLFPPPIVSGAGHTTVMTHLKTVGILLWAGSLLLAGLVAGVHYRPQLPLAVLHWFTQRLPERYRSALQKMLENFVGGLAGINSFYSFLVCLAFSLMVWSTLLLAYWSVAQAFGEPMTHLDPAALVLVLLAGATGSLAHLPGIGGGTQVATVLALTGLFGIPLDVASSAAILLWMLTYMMVLIPGLPLAAREGLTWQRLRRLTRAEV